MNILAALLRAGASASSRDSSNETPLSYAIDGNNAAALAVLLAHETCPGRADLSWELRHMVVGSFGGEQGKMLEPTARAFRASGHALDVRVSVCGESGWAAASLAS